ncbi:hypothetical protein CPHO_00245 [Corynebacterium phocae]|uniref:Nudix hydrolase domain-containing protein n=1 Tax=Corynebacterium phocae TaxID=161895 RepID=A0A1L7D0E2_9CORY|nr:NUDIX domain-containing protein [Corynebacterium phocae]APT91616.1 hypothetical protein CPHO_00245 [Corynebacterium phocae]KAA8720693.1 NUDIX domain-containing protein [Corynebacterium phocae]
MKEVHVSAVVFTDHAGRHLGVRKRGTASFMFPGGKPEPGETPAQTAVREIAEEIGVHAREVDLIPLGQRRAPAANEPGYTVVADMFAYPRPVIPALGNEIVEYAWVDHSAPHVALAPLSAGFRPS